jgi:catechol 2,3-dioxygenase-like lactoylglutathione lyase family enzyme
MIREIHIVSLLVSDQQRALEFWRDKVGFEVREDYPADPPSPRWLTVAPPGGQACFALLPPELPGTAVRIPGGPSGVSLTSDDLEADHERMSAAGVIFDRPPKRQPYGLEAGFADPDGNLFNVVQPF